MVKIYTNANLKSTFTTTYWFGYILGGFGEN